MDPQLLAIIQIVLRIVGAIVCVSKAKELNRSTSTWGWLGFIFPIVAMIWIHCLKPVTLWTKNIDIETKNKND